MAVATKMMVGGDATVMAELMGRMAVIGFTSDWAAESLIFMSNGPEEIFRLWDRLDRQSVAANGTTIGEFRVTMDRCNCGSCKPGKKKEESICDRCGKKGHFAKECREPRVVCGECGMHCFGNGHHSFKCAMDRRMSAASIKRNESEGGCFVCGCWSHTPLKCKCFKQEHVMDGPDSYLIPEGVTGSMRMAGVAIDKFLLESRGGTGEKKINS